MVLKTRDGAKTMLRSGRGINLFTPGILE